MPISPADLTTKDYELLLFISKFDSISRTEIHSKMKNKVDSIDYRLSQFKKVSFKGYVPIENSSLIQEEFDAYLEDGVTMHKTKDSFHITDFGKKVVQDYKVHIKEERFEFLKRSVLVPIVVAFLTTILIDVSKSLLPLILK